MMEEEEVVGHDEVEESAITVSSSSTDTDTISDALQEAAQPLVTEAVADSFAISRVDTSTHPSVPFLSSSTPVGVTSMPTQNVFRPIAPTIPTLPDLTAGSGSSPLVSAAVPTWTPSTAVPSFAAIPSLPINLSTPTRPPIYQPKTPGMLAGVSQTSAPAAFDGAAVNLGPAGGVGPPPPPTGGFVPAHGVVTATPGKHHSSLPMAPPSTLASHLLTPSTVNQSASTEFSSYSPQQPLQQPPLGLVGTGSYTPAQATMSPYSQPLAATDYGQGMMQSVSYPLGLPGVRMEPAPPSPQRSDRFFGWLPGSGLMHKMIEKTKSSVETVITTLDPGMKDVIYSGGNVNLVVTSSKEVKVGAVREAFQSVFGHATVTGMESQPSIAPQPVGYSSGVRGAEERIENLRQTGAVDEQQAIVSIENFIVELLPDRWFDVGCVILKDPHHGIDLMTFTQATPAPAECVCAAQDATPTDYTLRWSGLAMTVGLAVQQLLPHVDHFDWHSHYTGVSRRDMLAAAARSLAGLYKNQLAQQ